MSRLDRLQNKRQKRVNSRQKHYAEWERHKKHGQMGRAHWHLRRFEADVKAIKKLDRLIDKEEHRLASLRIDWNGCAPVGGPKLREVARYALNHFDVYVTSTNGGTHTPTSYHYRNEAIDIGADTTEAKIKCQHGLYDHFGPAVFAELFGPDNSPWVKNGATYTEPEGTALESLHDTHVHVAITN